jgi:oligogalacturonide lyase
MKHLARLLPVLLGLGSVAQAADPLPRSWVDPDTGHRIVQLTTVPNTSSLYFNRFGYSGGRLITFTRKTIDLITIPTGEIEHVYQGEGPVVVIQAGRKTGSVYYTVANHLYAWDPATKATRQLFEVPVGGTLDTINSDETLAAGGITAGSTAPGIGGGGGSRVLPPPPPGGYSPGNPQHGTDDTPGKMAMMIRNQAAHPSMQIYTVDLRTGERKERYHTNNWINHFEFSPTDPTLMNFAHEGPWWLVDRAWLFRVDGKSEPKLIHQRTMRMEIANHQYFSADGQWIWYDLETPMNTVFWVAGYNVYTGERLWYHISLDQWSIHYNRSPDGTLFSGDGGATDDLGPHPVDSKWMYLFHPSLVPDQQPPPGPSPGLVQIGTFTTEKLVNLSLHSYSVEPNGNFSPDGKWIVFRSNMRGPIEVYAVEVAKAK